MITTRKLSVVLDAEKIRESLQIKSWKLLVHLANFNGSRRHKVELANV